MFAMIASANCDVLSSVAPSIRRARSYVTVFFWIDCRDAVGDEPAGLVPAQVLEHHHARQDDRRRVDDIFTRILRRGAVGRLEKRDVVADVGPRRHAEPADLRRTGIRQIVAVQVGRRKHAVVGRPGQDLLEDAVGDPVVDDDLALLRRPFVHLVLGDDLIAELRLGDLVPPVTEGAFRELHDVALVHQRHGRPLVLDRRT